VVFDHDAQLAIRRVRKMLNPYTGRYKHLPVYVSICRHISTGICAASHGSPVTPYVVSTSRSAFWCRGRSRGYAALAV
jgi:hypothetical protein